MESIPDFVFDPKIHSPYHYVPSQTVAIIMLVIFGISTFAHLGQGVYYRTWFLLPTAGLCGILELLGWAGRLWSYYEPMSFDPFQMQITCTILAPTPLLAATFVIFGGIVNQLGTSYSRLSTKIYTIVFVTGDVISLVVQGVGGGLAATATPENGRDPDTGGRIMLGGISFQLLVITVFCLCFTDYMIRYLRDRPIASRLKDEKATPRGNITGKIKLMLMALILSTVALFIRAVYREIELVDGWDGRIISTELYFNVLDGAMVVLAMYLINIFHPGALIFKALPPASKRSGDLIQSDRSVESTIASNA